MGVAEVVLHVVELDAPGGGGAAEGRVVRGFLGAELAVPGVVVRAESVGVDRLQLFPPLLAELGVVADLAHGQGTIERAYRRRGDGRGSFEEARDTA